MPNLSRRRELFRISNAEDKLLLFHELLDAKEEMTIDLALALLKTIHEELSADQTKNRSVYKHYAKEIEALRFSSPVVLQQVVNAWRLQKETVPLEWFTYGQG